MAADGTFSGASGHGSRAGKRELAIATLLTSSTHAAAAEACGISIRTLQRWLKEDTFAEAYRQAKSDLVSGATMRLRSSALKAVEALVEISADKANLPAARVSASRAILEFTFAAHELEDLGTRLEKLEAERGNDEQS